MGKKYILLLLVTMLGGKVLAQPKWRPFAAAYLSVDAEAYYLVPTFSVGIEYHIKKRFALNGFIHHFRAKDTRAGDQLSLTSVGLLVQLNTGKKPNRGLFLSGGAVYQHREEWINRREIIPVPSFIAVIPAFKLGWRFPVNRKKNILSAELFGTGPYIPADLFENPFVEVFTQLSVGIRYTL